METQKVSMGEDASVVITCPKCKKSKEIPDVRQIGRQRFKVRCKCGNIFAVELEFRQKFRKDTDLGGKFIKVYEQPKRGELLYESETTNLKPINCKVFNISRDGIGLKTVGNQKLNAKKDEKIQVIFNLDNSANTEINKKAHIRWVKDNLLGGEFVEKDKGDVQIGFYLL